MKGASQRQSGQGSEEGRARRHQKKTQPVGATGTHAEAEGDLEDDSAKGAEEAQDATKAKEAKDSPRSAIAESA